MFFANEPIVRIVAPLPEAQLVETRLMNLLHFQTMIASKAARAVLQAPDKLLVDFGLRRAHGAEAGLLAARATYLAGMTGTATVLAGTAVRRAGVRHHGAFLHPGARQRDAGVRALRAQPSRQHDVADRHLRHRGGGEQGGAARAAAGARRHQDPRGAHRQRRPRRACAPGAHDPRRRRAHDVKIFASGGIDEFALRELLRSSARRSTASASAAAWTRRTTCPLSIAPTSCRSTPARAAQALGRQGDLARAQAGVAQLWRDAHVRRSAHAGGGRAAGRAAARPVMRAVGACPAWKRWSRHATAHAASWPGCPKRCARWNPHPLTPSPYPTHSSAGRRSRSRTGGSRAGVKATAAPSWHRSLHGGGGSKPSPSTTLPSSAIFDEIADLLDIQGANRVPRPRLSQRGAHCRRAGHRRQDADPAGNHADRHPGDRRGLARRSKRSSRPASASSWSSCTRRCRLR